VVTQAKPAPVRLADLELDLDVFAGPFDLLLTLILREEVDLLEVDLAEIVITYVDHLERRGELDLEAATEFLVLISALLELKSRLMLPGEEFEELELDPDEAASELFERLLAAHRYRDAGRHLVGVLAEQSGFRFRNAPVPPGLRRASLSVASAVYDPSTLVAALGGLLAAPPAVDVRHIPVPKVTVASRLALLRSLLRRGSFSFDEAVRDADRITVSVTLFALLELHKQGELSWIQEEPFGEVQVFSRTGSSAPERSRNEASALERSRNGSSALERSRNGSSALERSRNGSSELGRSA
jgi:segregation and condensation protein A